MTRWDRGVKRGPFLIEKTIYGEPGAPVSFVPEGYHVVESVEDGVPVFEVFKD